MGAAARHRRGDTRQSRRASYSLRVHRRSSIADLPAILVNAAMSRGGGALANGMRYKYPRAAVVKGHGRVKGRRGAVVATDHAVRCHNEGETGEICRLLGDGIAVRQA